MRQGLVVVFLLLLTSPVSARSAEDVRKRVLGDWKSAAVTGLEQDREVSAVSLSVYSNNLAVAKVTYVDDQDETTPDSAIRYFGWGTTVHLELTPRVPLANWAVSRIALGKDHRLVLAVGSGENALTITFERDRSRPPKSLRPVTGLWRGSFTYFGQPVRMEYMFTSSGVGLAVEVNPTEDGEQNRSTYVPFRYERADDEKGWLLAFLRWRSMRREVTPARYEPEGTSVLTGPAPGLSEMVALYRESEE